MSDRVKKALLVLILGLPSLGIVTKLFGEIDEEGFAQLLHTTGELGLRLLILTIVATPLAMVFRRGRFWVWMRRQRRITGLASFAYAVLHLAVYLTERGALQSVWEDLGQWTYVAGWLGMAAYLPLVLTSTTSSIRKLGGRRWKRLHLLTYGVAAISLLHWFLKPEGEVGPPMVHAILLSVFVIFRLLLVNRRKHEVISVTSRPELGAS